MAGIEIAEMTGSEHRMLITIIGNDPKNFTRPACWYDPAARPHRPPA
jgi:hypothetical protein